MTVPTATVSFIVRLTIAGDNAVFVGPFATEEEAEAWLDNMPADETLEDADVVCVCAPVRDDGEPNY
jgi:lactate dehydrogenase-like 2-hydroxyacid dehydrogenase